MVDEDGAWMGPLPAAPGCACQICLPDPEPTQDAQDRRVIDTVLQHGWQVMLVAASDDCSAPEHADHAGDDDESGLAFAYTIGLGHRAGHPELLISGLDPALMHRVLNGVTQRVLDGLRLTPGDAVESVLAGVPVAVEQISDAALQETVSWSGWFHRRKPEAVALVWPDRQGVFAWQPGGPDVLDERQPRAWRVPIEHVGGLAVDPVWGFPVPPEQRVFSCTHVVDQGDSVLWAARERHAQRGEDWSVHCGAAGHSTEDMRVVHLAHLVRSAPSLRDLSGLALGLEARRDHTDAGWQTAPLGS